MSLKAFGEVLTTLPGAIEGLYNVATGLSSLAKDSCLYKIGSSLASLKIPNPSHFYCAYNEAKSLKKLIKSEWPALKAKFKKIDAREEERRVMLALQNAPTKEAYLQILAQDAVYLNWQSGLELPQAVAFDCPQYQVKNVFEAEEGLKVVSIVPTDRGLEESPLVVIRGTDPTNIHNVADDLIHEIATMNTTKYAGPLKQILLQLTAEYGRVHILGHSYGGAVAQRLTSIHPELIKRVTSHNSPGVGKKVADLFKRNIKQLPAVLEKPEVHTIRHAKDMVSLLGGEQLPADSAITTGTLQDRISHLEAHYLNTLSHGFPVTLNGQAPRNMQARARDIERLRLELSKTIPFFQALKKARA